MAQQTVGEVDRFLEHGGIFRLSFGPKAFIVVSDPVVVRYLLKACPAVLAAIISMAFIVLLPCPAVSSGGFEWHSYSASR